MYCISELNARQHRRSPMSREDDNSPSNSEYSISEIASSAFKSKEDAKKIVLLIEEVSSNQVNLIIKNKALFDYVHKKYSPKSKITLKIINSKCH